MVGEVLVRVAEVLGALQLDIQAGEGVVISGIVASNPQLMSSLLKMLRIKRFNQVLK